MKCVVMKFGAKYLILAIGCLFQLLSAAEIQPLIPKHYENLTCILPNGEEGTCVYAYLCRDGKIDLYGTNLIDLRFGDACEDYLLKCCSKETSCSDFKGQCVPEQKCGVDVNRAEFSQFKKAHKQCEWSGYTCCPINEVGKVRKTDKDIEGFPTDYKPLPSVMGPDPASDEDYFTIPDPSHPDFNTVKPVTASNGKKDTVPDSSRPVFGPNTVKPVTGPDSVQPGTNPASDEITAPDQSELGSGPSNARPDPARKTCFNQSGICTPVGSCNGKRIRDRSNECGGLICCIAESAGGIPKDLDASSSAVASCVDYMGTCQLEHQCIDIYDQQTECLSSGRVCCLKKRRITTSTTTEKPLELEYVTRGCGYRNERGVHFRLLSASKGESEYGEFPWVVAIMTKNKKFVCGGSLISPEVVLTTADCTRRFRQNPGDMFVRAGEWDMGTVNEPIPYEERQVRLIKMHPKYKESTLLHNVALLFLTDSFVLNNVIDTVCLPPQNFSVENGDVLATGWGQTPTDRTKFQQILKKLELPFYPNSDCYRSLRAHISNRLFRLDDSFICAGGEPGIDTCKGDAGSPIIVPIPDDFEERRYAVGMVSWGVNCGKPGVPGVYTNIAKYRDWIDEQIREEDISTYYYEYQRQETNSNILE